MGKVWTKPEEREQLEKIKALVDETGVGSYLSISFSGFYAMAMANIENDFADNMPDAIEHRDEEIRQLKQKLANTDAKHGETLRKFEHECDCLADFVKAKDAEIEKLGHLLDAKTAECNRLKDERDVMTECHDGLAEMVDRYELEIQRLKAEVYDLRKWGESPVVPGDNPLRIEEGA